MAGKTYGLIYMSPIDIRLDIVNLKKQTVIDRVNSVPFVSVGNYQAEMPQIIETLMGFKQLMADYGVADYHFWWNYQTVDPITAGYICDQIKIRTDLDVDLLNLGQVTYLKNSAVLASLKQGDLQLATDYVYQLTLSPQGIVISEFYRHEFIQSWTISLNLNEFKLISDSMSHSSLNPIEIMIDYTRSKLEYLRKELVHSDLATLIIQDAWILNRHFLASGEEFKLLSRDELKQCFTDATQQSDQYLMQHYGFEEEQGARFLFGMIVIQRVFHYIAPRETYLTNRSIGHGLVLNEAARAGYLKDNYAEVILTAAKNIAERYQVDLHHANQVHRFAKHLFEQLKKLHRLDKKEELLLEVACYTDDIGTFINQSGHYDHSAYILQANPIIGLSDEENKIIAEISRYHSSESPETGQAHYRHLDNDIQMIVAKLASILRLADALDDSRRQKIDKISLSLKEGELIVTVSSNQNLALERWSFDLKASLFKEVFGVKPVFKQRRVKQA